MNLPTYGGVPIETERYEFYEDPSLFDLDRRDFFRIVGAGLVIALVLGDKVQAQQPGRGGQRGGGRGGGGPVEIGGWLHVGEDSVVTVYTGKVEIGQNARTSLTQAVAEELRTPVGQIKMIMADTALVPFDGGTFGSGTTPRMASQLRRVAIGAREVLLDMAAEQGKVDRKTLTVKDGKVVGSNGQVFEFGKLTKGQKIMKAVNEQAPTTPARDWKIAGTSVPKVDGRAIVTGTHQYASDIRRPGMLFGRVLRSPGYKGKLLSADTSEAESLPGVKVVREGNTFVGVVAPTEHAAASAIEAIKATWQPTPMPTSEEIYKHLKDRAGGAGGGRGGAGGRGGGGAAGGNRNQVEEGLKAADQTIKSTYNIAYIAHVALEPRAAVAEWADGKLTVWTGTQGPFRVRDQVATAMNPAPDRVRVIVPDMGSGYGGKHTNVAAVEAAKLAKAAGKPVKIVWTREEEFGGGYFRPSGVIEVTAGAKKDGTLTAWEFHNYNSGGSAIASPYDIPGQLTQSHGSNSPLDQGSYRGLAATANTFAREAAMDDLAHAIGMDPLEFRLKNLKASRDAARLSAVFRAAAEKFGWGKSKPATNRGFGIGGGVEKGSYVATCAEVSVDPRNGRVKVIRAVTAFECGAVVNPDHLKNQVEGAVVMGLGGALFEKVEFDKEKLLNPRLSDYRVPRFQDIPVLETVLLDRKDLASAGAGETPIVGISPAIRNAIAQACGKRLYAMPLAPEGVKLT